MEPLTSGKYPSIMRSIVKDRLPKFTRTESIMIKGSYDFVGLNYYSASYAADSNASSLNASRFSYLSDWHATFTSKHYHIILSSLVLEYITYFGVSTITLRFWLH